MCKDELIRRLYLLVWCWNETEKSTKEIGYGECASDLEALIEELAEQM